MLKHLNNRQVLFLVFGFISAFVLARTFSNSFLWPFFLGVPALRLLIEYAYRKGSEERARRIKKAIAELDTIHAGQRWLGSEAQIIAWPPGTYVKNYQTRHTLLCRTTRGTWFFLEVLTTFTRIDSIEVSEASKGQAEEFLMYDREKYRKYFELPEIA